MSRILAYVPVLHRGYLSLFKEHGKNDQLILIGDKLTCELKALTKNLAALQTVEIAQAIAGLGIFKEIALLEDSSSDYSKFFEENIRHVRLPDVNEGGGKLVAPDEDITRHVAKFLSGVEIEFVSIFLRWDSQKTVAQNDPVPDEKVTCDELSLVMMGMAFEQAGKAWDFWRQVGAVICRNGEPILYGYNRHLPSEQSPYIYGDPRANFSKGVNIELSTALHAEAGLIAYAARMGIALDGCDIYVTTFPCPGCAKIIAESGFRSCYFSEGYTVLDGEDIMRDRGIEIVRVIK